MPQAGRRYSLDPATAAGATTVRSLQVALNRTVRRASFPDIGFRALRLQERYDLVHVHAHPSVLLNLGETPLVLSEGSSSAVYLGAEGLADEVWSFPSLAAAASFILERVAL